MARIYLETSFVSACVETHSDAASVYQKDIGQRWWSSQRFRHECFVSAEVVRELSHPTYHNRTPALELIAALPLLPISAEVVGLAHILVREKAMPSPVAGDAVHIAAATVHAMDYVLSWNVRHLANPNKLRHLRTICLRAGLTPPLIVTPEHVWENDDD